MDKHKLTIKLKSNPPNHPNDLHIKPKIKLKNPYYGYNSFLDSQHHDQPYKVKLKLKAETKAFKQTLSNLTSNHLITVQAKQSYLTNKNSLKNLLNNQSPLQNFDHIIQDAVARTNQIVIHTYQFLKLYLIWLKDQNLPFPTIDLHFLEVCMSIVSYKNDRRGRKPKPNTLELINKLIKFFQNQYQPLLSNPLPCSSNLGIILKYEAIDMFKNIKNNIALHYIDHVKSFINWHFGVKKQIKEIEKKKLSKKESKLMRKQIYDLYRSVKQDILDINRTNPSQYTSDQKFHDWITQMKKVLLPQKLHFDKNNLHYDVKSNSIDYLPCMIGLNQLIERIHIERQTLDCQPIKKRLFQALPLRSQIKPQYITLDTTCLIHLLCTGKVTEYSQNVKKYEEEIWSKFFNLKLKCFKRGQKYVFHHMIRTDGVGASIILIRKDLVGKYVIQKANQSSGQKYLDQCHLTEEMKQQKIVGIDPNKRDLIYCSDESGKTFRYTTDQIRVETRKKKYQKMIEMDKKSTQITEKTVEELESQLSVHTSKTCHYDLFVEYLRAKNQLNSQLFDYYGRPLFRKLKLNQFINRQKSESQMINRFQQKYGPPSEVLIAFGDHQQGGHQMRYHEPTKDVGIRNLFCRNGYDVYLIDEFRTSCRCSKCGNKTEKFLRRKNPRPWRKRSVVEVHGLLRCQSVECQTVWNRDYNASQNMVLIAKNIIGGLERPSHLRRKRLPMSSSSVESDRASQVRSN